MSDLSKTGVHRRALKVRELEKNRNDGTVGTQISGRITYHTSRRVHVTLTGTAKLTPNFHIKKIYNSHMTCLGQQTKYSSVTVKICKSLVMADSISILTVT